MVNYQLGKIYKIVCNTTGKVYIGSTCESSLARRLTCHTSSLKRWREGKIRKNITSFEVMENNNYEIILIENYPCNSKDELHARERVFIENNDCVNSYVPNRTRKEYYADNIEKYRNASKKRWEEQMEQCKEANRKWSDEHREERKIYNKIWCQANKQKRNEASKKWYHENKVKLKAKRLMKSNANI